MRTTRTVRKPPGDIALGSTKKATAGTVATCRGTGKDVIMKDDLTCSTQSQTCEDSLDALERKCNARDEAALVAFVRGFAERHGLTLAEAAAVLTVRQATIIRARIEDDLSATYF